MSEKKQYIAKQVLFSILLILMTIPLIHHLTRGSKEEDGVLSGAIEFKDYKQFSWDGWFDQSYQKNTSEYLKENFGYRPFFVRIHNSRLYYMYKMAKAKSVVVGGDDYLYELNYIKAHFGKDFIGEDAISEKVRKLSYIKAQLEERNKKIIVLLAPGKGSFFPEKIPLRFQQKGKWKTNFQGFRKQLVSNGIDLLDFHTWFLGMKGKSKYPLYPKCGVHWSKYGEYLVADSMIHYIEKVTESDLPNLILDTITVEKINRDGDFDIGEGMNLLHDLDTYPLAYPKYHFEEDSNLFRPNTIVVADSYYWGMFNAGLSNKCFSNGKFWYYNKQIFPDHYNEPTLVADKNIKEEVEKSDVIIIICTDANLSQFAFGFIDQLYDALKSNID